MAFKVRKYEIWDVVNVPAFPNQEDPGETTGRPTIILEDLEDSAVIFPITKQIDQASRYKYVILIDENSDEAKTMGLRFTSILILDRAYPLPKMRLANVIGQCPDSIIIQIETLLEQAKKDGVKF
jgi:hypothetical protein